jgi:hypothetical protein
MEDPGSFQNRESHSSASAPSLAAMLAQVQENESACSEIIPSGSVASFLP